jgi:hypothetical protein
MDRHAAEAEVCMAIASLGRLAGIDVDMGDGPEDIDGSLIQATYESNFLDPEFLGGPGCFGPAGTPADVAALAARASQVTRGLCRYIGRRRSGAVIREAQSCLAAIDDTFAWLAQQNARTSQ